MFGSRFFAFNSRFAISPVFSSTVARVSGAGIGLYGAHLLRARPVACNVATEADFRSVNYQPPIVQQRRSHFDGKLDYQQLSTGSFLGLFLGYVTGKISKLLCFMTVTGLLTVQFLESRGILNTSNLPFTTRVSNFIREKFHVKEFITVNPSFKLSFFSSFIIAALYA